MIQLDLERKLEKFRNVQVYLTNHVERNQGKIWNQIDDLEKQQRQVLYSQDQLIQHPKTPNPNPNPTKSHKKSTLINEYQNSLQKLRTTPKQYHNPFNPHQLKMDILSTIQVLRQAKDFQKDIPEALKMVGIKSLKTLYVGGAKRQFQVVIGFLEDGRIPNWIVQGHRKLMKKKEAEFNSTVKSCLRP